MPINLPLVDAYWRVGSLFSDSPADADRDPDIGWADEGTAILAPVVGNLRYTDENGRMATLTNAPKVGTIKPGGRIAWEADSAAVDNTIRLVDLTDPSITGHVNEPGAKTHTLTVRNVKVDGVAVFGTRTDFDVRISLDTAGPDGVVNLAEQVPLEAAAPIVVDLRKGDQGVGVESVDQDAAADGDLVLNLTDGSTTTPVPLPPGVVPDDSQLATALGQPQAKGALSAQIEQTAQALIDAGVPPLIAEALAADPAVRQAAANAVQAALSNTTLPAVTTITGSVFRLEDTYGNPSWIEAAEGTGRPTTAVAHALANVLHAYTGPDEPVVWPGNWLIWTPTDSSRIPGSPILVEG